LKPTGQPPSAGSWRSEVTAGHTPVGADKFREQFAL